MLPDLRPVREYPKPLPRGVLYVYSIGVLLLFVATTSLLVEWRDSRKVDAVVAVKRGEISAALARIKSFESRVEGLESSRGIRASREAWKNETIQTAALQAATVLAIAETEDALVDSFRKSTGKGKGKRTAMIRRAAEEPRLVLKSLTVQVAHEIRTVEVKTEIVRNWENDSRQLTAELSSRLGQVNPAGLRMANSKPPEDRGSSTLHTTTWRPVALAAQ